MWFWIIILFIEAVAVTYGFFSYLKGFIPPYYHNRFRSQYHYPWYVYLFAVVFLVVSVLAVWLINMSVFGKIF